MNGIWVTYETSSANVASWEIPSNNGSLSGKIITGGIFQP
jgi:hypothetical protein